MQAGQVDAAAHQFFIAVVDALTNDGFMGFISAWVDNHTLLSGRSYIEWVDASSPSAPSSSSSLVAFTNAHFAIFQNYQTIFESRLRSTLRTHANTLQSISGTSNGADGACEASIDVLEAQFYELCAKHQQQRSSSSSPSSAAPSSSSAPRAAPALSAADAPSVSKRVKMAAAAETGVGAEGAESGEASTADLVETLLLIIETVTDFSTFAAMMADRQAEGLQAE